MNVCVGEEWGSCVTIASASRKKTSMSENAMERKTSINDDDWDVE